MITVRKHLVDKLRHVFAMLNRLEGVSEPDTLLKQGEDTEKPSTKEHQKPAGTSGEAEKAKGSDPKVNVASGSKGKEKIIDDDDDDEDEEDKSVNLKWKARDEVLDETCESQERLTHVKKSFVMPRLL
ncbi:unnamed protein product [Lactuca saligna]|uniref:Uncharacterized protein n=1 Tax=Lactuca saligna TaxID=75948 RepID=A0AA36DWH4_LACSI|nr:unnamed protein product [Lactuca saligna]